METNRASITYIVNGLLEEGLVREGERSESGVRGRKPTFLFIKSEKTFAIAIDVRASQTFMMITDSIGTPASEVASFATETDPKLFVDSLAAFIRRSLSPEFSLSDCKGIGIALPGMIDSTTNILRHAPTLGWHDLDLLTPLQQEFDDVEIYLENSAKACALSQMWSMRNDETALNDIVFVSVSDGVGLGIVTNGELTRGKHNSAGEFGHIPLNIDGPPCFCGANGCWEVYVSNLATLSRYFGHGATRQPSESLEEPIFTVDDLIAHAHNGDSKALAALYSTARYLGLGLASVINALDPACVFLSGEITDAWDLIEERVRNAINERALSKELGAISIRIVPAGDFPRLRGAAALVNAPAFAAPKLA